MSRKESNESGIIIPKRDAVRPVSIVDEMKHSFIEYAMSVITSRALPDVRDGLKPVHRRILYAMHDMGLTAGARFRKSAAIVGEVLGKYHPHGDISVYDAMVTVTQPFSYRYPLILGQGNFGSIDGDSQAAMRYTEAKMSRISGELLAALNKETVEFGPNYDSTRTEPLVLPASVPNLLLNGVLGIAVGMATNIPPHNLGEVINATITLIDNPKATNDDLLEHVQGPDFPLGGTVYNKRDIAQAYTTGRGSVVVRGQADIEETKAGKYQIIITSLTYRGIRSNLIIKIADLVQEKKLKGIRDIRDESTDDTRIVIELKSDANPQRTLNYIYKHTELESNFGYNMTALVDGVPQLLSLKEILHNFILHRKEVVRRRTEFELKKAEARAHILEGLSKALDHIDEVISVIKKSKDTGAAKENLMQKFKFSELQALAILDMRLQKLAGLERKKVEDELHEKKKLIAYLQDLLKHEKKMLFIIVEELKKIKETYGDERRTKVAARAVQSISDEDLIPDKESVLVFTSGGYVKRSDPDEYRKQGRGGIGVIDMNTKEEDVITNVLTTSTLSDLLFFTDKGKAYSIKMYDIPEMKRSAHGNSINNFIALSSDEKVTSILAMPKEMKKLEELSLVILTKHGLIKKVAADSFKNVRRNGLIAINLKDGDELLAAGFVMKKDNIILVTRNGQSIRFAESDVRQMGRGAGGVRAIKLGKNDNVVGADIVRQEYQHPLLLVISDLGYGKKTLLSEYKVQHRGGSGILTSKVTNKIGYICAARVIAPGETELITISEKSQIIRVDLSTISKLGRATQGVRIMKLREGDKVASIALL